MTIRIDFLFLAPPLHPTHTHTHTHTPTHTHTHVYSIPGVAPRRPLERRKGQETGTARRAGHVRLFRSVPPRRGRGRRRRTHTHTYTHTHTHTHTPSRPTSSSTGGSGVAAAERAVASAWRCGGRGQLHRTRPHRERSEYDRRATFGMFYFFVVFFRAGSTDRRSALSNTPLYTPATSDLRARCVWACTRRVFLFLCVSFFVAF